jgi:DNA invertase Pin-like site-specific DNA recombinase
MTTSALRLDILIRVSQRKDEAKSPQQQLDICRTTATVNGYTIAKIHDSGASESGQTMARASVDASLARMRSGETDGVLVAFLDRFGRAPIEEAMSVFRQIGQAGGVLVPADTGGQPIDPDDPQAETQLVIQLQFARQMWRTAAKRFKLSQSNAITRGAYIGKAPFGYRRDDTPGPKLGCLVPDKNGPIVSEAYKRAARDGIHAAADFLGRNTDSTRKLLRSRIYLGELHHTAGINMAAHDALTDLGTWTAAQTKPNHRRHSADYPLSAIARCETCQGPLTGQLQSVPGRTSRRYRCSTKGNGHASILASALEGYVRETIREAIGSHRVTIGMAPDGLTEAESALLVAEGELQRFATDLDMREILGDAAWRSGAKVRSEAVDQAREAYQTIASAAAQVQTMPAAGELDDDEAFVLVLRAMIASVTVKPGRNVISNRCRIAWN